MSLRLQKSVLRKHRSSKPSSKRFTILLVDDEPENLDSLSLVLDKDYNLLFAADGVEALKVIEEQENPQSIHMILSDQRMPNMTGAALFKRTCEILPAAVRIILTGYTDMQAAMDAINDGHVYKFLTKPIDPVDLRQCVREGLELHEDADSGQDLAQLKKRVADAEQSLTTYKKFVPQQLSDKVFRDGQVRPGQFEADSAAVLVADLRSFNSAAAQIAPEEFLAQLNEYYSVLGQPISDQQGFVQGYNGDALVALFNTSRDNESRWAEQAVHAALGIQAAMKEFNTGGPEVRVSIGIHSGPIMFGTVGLETHMDIAIMGETIATAALLERQNEPLGTSVIVSETVKNLLVNDGPQGNLTFHAMTPQMSLSEAIFAVTSPD